MSALQTDLQTCIGLIRQSTHSVGPGLTIDYAGDASKRCTDENVHARCLHQCSYNAQETHESTHHTRVKYDVRPAQRLVPWTRHAV